MKNIISKDRAQQICNNWHSGQWSALYQFGSSKIWDIKNALRYVLEVQNNLQSEYFTLYETKAMAKKSIKELTQLRDFFMFKAKENNVPIELVKHSEYGYQYPLLSPNGIPVNMMQVDSYTLPK